MIQINSQMKCTQGSTGRVPGTGASVSMETGCMTILVHWNVHQRGSTTEPPFPELLLGFHYAGMNDETVGPITEFYLQPQSPPWRLDWPRVLPGHHLISFSGDSSGATWKATIHGAHSSLLFLFGLLQLNFQQPACISAQWLSLDMSNFAPQAASWK